MPAPHRYPVSIFYADTDAGGVVYHSHYLTYGERARSQLLREEGVSNSALMKERNLAFMVREAKISYLKPAVLDDALTVETTFTDRKGASCKALHAVKRGDETLVTLEVALVCVSASPFKPAKIPDDLARVFQKYAKDE